MLLVNVELKNLYKIFTSLTGPHTATPMCMIYCGAVHYLDSFVECWYNMLGLGEKEFTNTEPLMT